MARKRLATAAGSRARAAQIERGSRSSNMTIDSRSYDAGDRQTGSGGGAPLPVPAPSARDTVAEMAMVSDRDDSATNCNWLA